jgi:hypothetical protein
LLNKESDLTIRFTLSFHQFLRLCLQTLSGKSLQTSFVIVRPCLQTVCKQIFGVSLFPVVNGKQDTRHHLIVSYCEGKCSECGQARIRLRLIFCNQSSVATLQIRFVNRNPAPSSDFKPCSFFEKVPCLPMSTSPPFI